MDDLLEHVHGDSANVVWAGKVHDVRNNRSFVTPKVRLPSPSGAAAGCSSLRPCARAGGPLALGKACSLEVLGAVTRLGPGGAAGGLHWMSKCSALLHAPRLKTGG